MIGLVTVTVALAQSGPQWNALTHRILLREDTAIRGQIFAKSASTVRVKASLSNAAMRNEAEERFHAALDELRAAQPEYFAYLSQKYGFTFTEKQVN